LSHPHIDSAFSEFQAPQDFNRKRTRWMPLGEGGGGGVPSLVGGSV
jgi:hypothetical protein